MDAVRQQVEQNCERDGRLFTRPSANPAVAAPHLETISAEQINEVIGTVVWWLNRAKAPKGFAPRFIFGVRQHDFASIGPYRARSIQGGQ